MSGSSFTIPARARAVKTTFKPGGKGRGLVLSEVERKKSKRPLRRGIKRLLREFQKPPGKKSGRKFETTREYLARRLGNEQGIWRLSVGVIPTALYWDAWRFFTDPGDLTKKWKQVRIWYALESDGNSDGSTNPEGVKSYYIGSTFFKIGGSKLSERLLNSLQDFVEERLFGVETEDGGQNGIAVQHNNAGFKQWREEVILLGVEGAENIEVSRKTGPGRQAKRVRARK